MNQLPAIPMLLADWAEVIGLLVVVVFSILRYLFSEVGEGEKKPAQGRKAPRPEQQPQLERADGEQGQLRSEVDEFLRRAKGLPEPEPEPEAEPVATIAPAAEPWQGTTRLEPAEAPPHDSLRDTTVAEHVASHVRHLEESQLAENAAHLGAEVALADDKVEARLEAKFDHDLGKLSSRSPETQPPPVPEAPGEISAEQIAAMLASPEGIRNAIILNEILHPPVSRW